MAGPLQNVVRVAHSAHGAANSPFSIAESEGYFTAHGLTVQRSEVANVSAAMDTLSSGTGHIVGAAGAAILSASLSGIDPVVVLSIEARNLFAVIGAAGVTHPGLLRGATLGISRRCAPDHVILNRALSEWGISPEKDVTLVELQSRGAVWSALRRGEIAAMTTTIPQPIIARADGLPILLDFAELDEPYQLGAVVATRQFIAEQRPIIAAFVSAMREAVERFRTDRTLALRHMAARSKVTDRDVLNKTYELFAEGMAFPRPDPAALGNVARDYSRVDAAIRGIDIGSLIDTSFVLSSAPASAAKNGTNQ
jgi:ABC-type nitrate/sulfonate/bicarbonate transport system substrate-binding protein